MRKTVVVTQLGGEIGEVGEVYSGAARFVEDEEVLIFLDPAEAGRRRRENEPQVLSETCTMCSNMCALKLSEKALAD